MASRVISGPSVVRTKQPTVVDSQIIITPEEMARRASTVREQEILDQKQRIAQLYEAWDQERASRQKAFDDERQAIVSEAENEAFDRVKAAVEEYDAKIDEARREADKILTGARAQKDDILNSALETSEQREAERQETEYQRGYDEGYEVGKSGIFRFQNRLYSMLSVAVRKRERIVGEANHQIMHFTLIVARRVVKAIVEEEKRVVYDNIVELLRGIRGRAEITILVNQDDLNLVARHRNEFIEVVETAESLRIREDNSVDRGGVIVETDFGRFDGTIVTQMNTIETLVRKAFDLGPDRLDELEEA